MQATSSLPEEQAVPRWRGLVVLLVLLIGLFTSFLQLQSHIRFDDDNAWLYLLGQRGLQVTKVYEPEQQVIDYVRQCGGTPDSLSRLEMRRDYGANYWLAAQLWHGMGLLYSAPPQADKAAYATYIHSFLPVMLFSGVVIAWCVLAVVLWRMRNRQLLLATFIGVSLLAIATSSDLKTANVFLLIYKVFSLGFLKNLISNFVYPTYAYSLFGFTPRNYAAVLLLAVVLLRWQGKYCGAYLLLLPCYLLHSSFTLLAAVHLLALDILQNRKALQDRLTFIIILAGLLYGLQRETLWEHVAGSSFAIPALIIVTGVAAVGIYTPLPWQRVQQRLPRIHAVRERLYAMAPVGRDILLLALLWLIGLLVVDRIDGYFSEFQRTYLWSQLHGRLLAALQPIFFVGLAYVLLSRTPQPKQRGGVAIVILALLAWSGWQVWQAVHMPAPEARVKVNVDYLDSIIAREPWTMERNKPAVPVVLAEPIIYYLLGRDATLGTNSLSELYDTRYFCTPAIAAP